MASRVRIVDIASVLNLSVSTVSKSLTGSREISAETALKVKNAAESMGYSPNGVARRLRSGKAQAIGLLCLDGIGWQSIPVLMGAEEEAGAEEIMVLLTDSRGDVIKARHHIRTMLEHGIDGIIVLSGNTNDHDSLGNIGVPIVYAYGPSRNPSDYSVVPDESNGAREAVELLVNLGREHIGHIAGSPNYAAAQWRAKAAEDTLNTWGLGFAGGAPLLGEWTENWGRTATDILLRRAPYLDAIFCGSDSIARGAYDTLRARGKRIPSDVAVIGFDNWETTAVGAQPTLSSVDMNLETVGRTAVRALLEAIDGIPRHGVEKLPCQLVLRQSTAGRDLPSSDAL